MNSREKNTTAPSVEVKFRKIAFLSDILLWCIILPVFIWVMHSTNHLLWVMVAWILLTIPLQLLWLFRRLIKKVAYTFNDRGIHFHYGLYNNKTIEWKHIIKVSARSLWFPSFVPKTRYFLLFIDNEKQLTERLNWFQRPLADFNKWVFKTPVLINVNIYLDHSFDEIGTLVIDRLKKYQR